MNGMTMTGPLPEPSPTVGDLLAELALNCDADGLLAALWEHHAIDVVVRQICARWPSVPRADIDFAVCEAADTLAVKCTQGRLDGDHRALLVKISMREVQRVHIARRRLTPTDPMRLREVTEAQRWEELADDDRRRERIVLAVRTAREIMIGGPVNERRVMDYYLDVVERGIPDASSTEVGDALGIPASTVRKHRERGFARLTTRARDLGLVGGDFSLLEVEVRSVGLESDADEADSDGRDERGGDEDATHEDEDDDE